MANGYRVLICARGADRLAETARDLGPDRVAWHACDVGDEGAADEAIAAAIARFGRLDGLVCAAGVLGSFTPIAELTPADWASVLGINLMGPIFFTKAATPALRDSGGAVVIVSSVNALQAEPVMAPYGVAKAGLVNFTMYAALELAPAGVRVNCVAPGWVMTPMAEPFFREAGVLDAPVGFNMQRRAARPAELGVGDRLPARRRRLVHDRDDGGGGRRDDHPDGRHRPGHRWRRRRMTTDRAGIVGALDLPQGAG